jgi:hypothetical protein
VVTCEVSDDLLNTLLRANVELEQLGMFCRNCRLEECLQASTNLLKQLFAILKKFLIDKTVHGPLP